jgi:hypothetical protein
MFFEKMQSVLQGILPRFQSWTAPKGNRYIKSSKYLLTP